MKTYLVGALIASLAVALLAACGSGKATPAPETPAATAAPALATTASTPAPTTAPTAVPPSPTPAPSPTPTPALGSVQPTGSAREQVLAAYQKMFGRSYRNESTIKADTGEITQVGEYAPPDRLRSVTASANFTSEVIMIGDQAWSRQNGSAWAAMPAAAAITIKQMQSMAEETMTNAEALGSQTLDGRKVWVYRYQSAFEGVTSTTTLFVDAATGLPVQQEVVGEAAGVTSTTVQRLTYPDDISIEAPLP